MTASESQGSAPQKPVEAATPLMCVLALLPVLLHVVGLVVSAMRQDAFQFRKLDLAVSLVVVAYLCVAGIALRSRERTIRFLLVSYSALIAIGTFEVFAVLSGVAARPGSVPWPPLRWVWLAGNTVPGVKGKVVFSVNDIGLRGPKIALRKAAVKILCVGGSTTECLYVSDKQSWPWLLGTQLSRTTDQLVFVGNAGKSGNFTLHHEYILSQYDYADQFDWIVMLCGINDAGTLLRGNYEERAKRVPAEALVVAKSDGAYYRHSAIAYLIERLTRPKPDPEADVAQDPMGDWYANVRRKREDALARNTIRTMPPGLSTAIARYRENLTRIVKLCKRRNQNLLLLTQPALYHANMSAELSDLIWQHTDAGAYTPEILERVIHEYNCALMAVCREQRVEYIDLAALLPKDTSIFYDDCHFNVSGCKRVADILTEYFTQMLEK